ncbi:calcium homeostasis endoplasmic reticulum protein [Musca vetustissima]|uniref:calcium homeostasis endoplasmic reticulum protein n=1 Tax=Musca vetustissima TaxID=27455 RepID=UPI002AB6220F|nr:calcium homeostasis endoplasmic reticulum protein [Musca vetustissima]
MDGPPPPRDASLRNIIDKLAEFVARNGPEFEMITKQKQQNNPKFEFLYGGEYAAYYQYRVQAEQVYLKQQGQGQQGVGPMMHPQQQMQQYQNQQQQSAHFTQGPPPNMLHHQGGGQMMDGNNFAMNQPPPSHQLWNSAPPSSGPMNVGMPPQQHPQQQQQQQQQQSAQQHQRQQSQPPNTGNIGGNQQSLAMTITAQIEAINMQQNTLREQIRQSEANLTAQHTALVTQQKKQIEEAIEEAQNKQLEKQAEEQNISLKEFDGILQPIIDACTKDSISQGKNWILQHSSDSAKNNVVLQYLLKKALADGSTFQQKLHLIYLINDILHHCVRKNANDLKNSLENVVIPMFCSADLIANTDQRAKLTKLLSLWESKAKFFDACVISKLQSPDSSMQEYKTNLQNLHHETTSKFTQALKTQMDNYKKQHQMFIQHAAQQITQLEQQKQQMEQQMLASVMPNSGIMPLGNQQQQQTQAKTMPTLMGQKMAMPPMNDTDPFGNSAAHTNTNNAQCFPNAPAAAANNFFIPDLSKPPPGFVNPAATAGSGVVVASNQQIPPLMQQTPYAQMNSNIPQNQAMINAPPNSLNPGEILNNVSNLNVDLRNVAAALQMVQQQQQPTNAYDNQTITPHAMGPVDDGQLSSKEPEEDPKPSAAYYDLPAGLMVPLIRLEDYNYKPLDPEDIRLPPPAPQTERLTNALAAFYSLPTHDRPRDNEGWEKLGLYEYYKVKNAARKQKEEDIRNGVREKSRSPSPIVLEKPKPKKTNKRCYRSKSRSRSASPRKSRTRSRSRSRSPVRATPNRNDRGGGGGGRNNRYNRRSRSPRRSPPRDRERERDRDRENDRNTRRERERSVTPPSFLGSTFAKPNDFIDESNKGHQMLMKMGWSGAGTGLGTKNQGIDQPISGGEVRDRKDLYKGVGVNMNDPYENFRKNKGAAFVFRMRTRDEKS